MTRTDHLLGLTVRDPRSGVTGKVIGYVIWDRQPTSLVVQPSVRLDQTVPLPTYVPEAVAEIVPQANEPGAIN